MIDIERIVKEACNGEPTGLCRLPARRAAELARDAERERCAKIADAYGAAMPGVMVRKGRNSECIAAAIRSGKEVGSG